MGRLTVDEKLDQALKQTFPASDAFALSREDEPDSGATYASSPCFLHELEASDLGYLNRAEVLSLLNQLLESGRAGARGIGEMSEQTAIAKNRAMLRKIAKDEARFCAMLARHVERLGGAPSTRTGASYTHLSALGAASERLDLLNRGQRWVVRTLSDALPRISDMPLRKDLGEMLEAYLRSIEQCSRS